MFAMALRVSKLDGNTHMCIRPFRNLTMQVLLLKHSDLVVIIDSTLMQ